MLVEAGLLGQAGLRQHVSGQLCGKRRFFLCSKLLFGERLGRFALGLAHAGETHLLRLALCLLFRHLRFEFFGLASRLLDHGFLHGCDILGQTHVVGTVDQLAFAVGQVGVGQPFTLERVDERLGDVLDIGLDDRQQQLQSLVLGGLLLLGLDLAVKFGDVGLHLQALLLGLGLLHRQFFPQLGRLLFSLHLFDLSCLQLVDHVAGLGVACSGGFCNRWGLFPGRQHFTKQVRLCRLKLAWPRVTFKQRHLASFSGGAFGPCRFPGRLRSGR